MIDKDLVKKSVNQFVIMGYEERTLLRRIEGSSEPLSWIGEKNFMLYDTKFEE